MTTLVRYADPFLSNSRWIVNGCLFASMSREELVSIDDYRTEAIRRVTPLVWLAMPVHDDNQTAALNQEQQR